MKWIQQVLSDLYATTESSEIYYERKGKNIKQLIEEAVPVARLALHLSSPVVKVEVSLKLGNQNYDALISMEPIRQNGVSEKKQCKVEVTTTEDAESTLRRQALSRLGSVNLMGKIRREGDEIYSDDEFVDVKEDEEKRTEKMFERFRRKVESKRYDKDTIILVNYADIAPLSMLSRMELVSRTNRYITSY